MKVLLTSTLAVVFCTLSMGAVAEQNWPEAISIPTGFESEGIELGKALFSSRRQANQSPAYPMTPAPTISMQRQATPTALAPEVIGIKA
jgi:hypothetical protein